MPLNQLLSPQNYKRKKGNDGKFTPIQVTLLLLQTLTLFLNQVGVINQPILISLLYSGLLSS
jgi:hypothetical protein